MLNQGTYIAKLTGYGIKMTNAGKPQISCQFSIISDESVYNLTWFGSFNEGKAQEMTIKTLVGVFELMCEPSEIETMLGRIAAEGVESGLLNMDKDYQLVVEHDVYEGKTRPKIRWVNNPGSGQAFEKLAGDVFKGMNLGGTVAAIKAQNPGLFKPKKATPF